jgi:hypothetical protein
MRFGDVIGFSTKLAALNKETEWQDLSLCMAHSQAHGSGSRWWIA